MGFGFFGGVFEVVFCVSGFDAKIWSINKNGQNLGHQKEWSKFDASKRMVKIWGIKKNGPKFEENWKF